MSEPQPPIISELMANNRHLNSVYFVNSQGNHQYLNIDPNIGRAVSPPVSDNDGDEDEQALSMQYQHTAEALIDNHDVITIEHDDEAFLICSPEFHAFADTMLQKRIDPDTLRGRFTEPAQFILPCRSIN
jgi:hypothetical protein